ncbi:MAG: zinc-binding dehydrogenase [Pseudomonadota bacterium]
MVTCGASAGHDPKTDIRYIWSFEQTIIGSDGWSMEDQREILEMTATGVLKPIIHAVRPFSQAREAMLDMAERRVFGKLILVPDALMSDAA